LDLESYGVATNIVVILLTVFYGSLITSEFRALRSGNLNPEASRDSLSWLQLALVVHLVVIVIRGFEVGSCPVASRWEAFSLLAFLIASLQWVLVVLSKDRSTLIFGLGFAFLLQLGSASFSLTLESGDVSKLDAIRSLHAFSALLGVAGVAIAGIHGILWMLLRSSIKRGNFGLLFNNLSSLESLSKLLRTATSISAITLTISLVSAFLLVDEQNINRSLGYESYITVFVWLVFTVLALVPRSNHSVTVWRTLFSIGGFVLVLFVLLWISVFGFHSV
jgi:ABC-type uncharacterized transport system permease subunit